MKLFWLLMTTSLLSVGWFVYFSAGPDPFIFIIFIDIMATWFFIETKQGDSIKGIIKGKIETLERLTADLFERLNSKTSDGKTEKKDIIKWLDKF